MFLAAAAKIGRLLRALFERAGISGRNFFHDFHLLDEPGAFGRISLVGESLERDLHERGIRHKGAPVGVHELHRFGERMEVLRGVVLPLSDREGLHDVQQFDDVRAAARCGRNGIDRVAAIGSLDGLAFDERIVREIFLRHRAPCLVDGGHDRIGYGALVEGVGAVLGKQAKCFRKLGLLQDRALLRRQAVDDEDARGTVFRELLEFIGDDLLLHRMDFEAFLGEAQRRFGDLCEGHGPILPKSGEHPLHGAGDADGLSAEFRLLRLFRRLGGEHILRRGLRSDFAIVQDDHFVRLRVADRHEAAAADSGSVRFDDIQRELRRNSRIDRISALLEDFDPRLRGQFVGGRNHSVLRTDIDNVGRRGRARNNKHQKPNTDKNPFHVYTSRFFGTGFKNASTPCFRISSY